MGSFIWTARNKIQRTKMWDEQESWHRHVDCVQVRKRGREVTEFAFTGRGGKQGVQDSKP